MKGCIPKITFFIFIGIIISQLSYHDKDYLIRNTDDSIIYDYTIHSWIPKTQIDSFDSIIPNKVLFKGIKVDTIVNELDEDEIYDLYDFYKN